MPNYSWSFLRNCVHTLRNTLFLGLCPFRGEILCWSRLGDNRPSLILSPFVLDTTTLLTPKTAI